MAHKRGLLGGGVCRSPMMPVGPRLAQPVTYSPGSGSSVPALRTRPALHQPKRHQQVAGRLEHLLLWAVLGFYNPIPAAACAVSKQHMLMKFEALGLRHIQARQPSRADHVVCRSAGVLSLHKQVEASHLLAMVPDASSKATPGMGRQR